MFMGDTWRWLSDVYGFSMMTAYKAQLFLTDSSSCEIFRKIWAVWAPAKVHAFGRRLALGRLPTLDNLIKRGIVTNGGLNQCYFCHNHSESVNHLFFECAFPIRCGKNALNGWVSLRFYQTLVLLI